MVDGLFHIKLNSSEQNKDSGFYTLMLSGASIFCLEDDEYIVPEVVIPKLNQKKIAYEVIIEKEASKKGEEKDATKT